MSSVLISDLSADDGMSLEAAGSAQVSDGVLSTGSLSSRPASYYHPVAGVAYDGPLVDRGAEEWLNSLTHGIGAVLSSVGAFFLLGQAALGHDHVVYGGCVVYLMTLLGVYVCSTLSHYIEHTTWKQAFRVYDQAFIYLLIVGSYTPIAATHLHGGFLSLLFWSMWGAAILGFLSKTVLKHRVNAIATGAYVMLAWMPMLASYEALSVVPMSALVLVGCGGACYMLGLVFFMRDHRVRYAHAAWHVLVMAGSTFHFYAISQCVAAVSKAAGVA